MSKVRHQKRHTKMRAAQRYDVWLSSDDVKSLVAQIQNGKAEFVDRQSNRVTLWIVEHQGTKIRVVYDKQRKSIVTCLPLSAS